MSRPKKALTPEQVKQRLRMQGITTTQWAEARGYTRNEVYRVLNGQAKAHYGKAHDIAVALGMKLADDQPTSPAEPRNPQKRVA
ncbi:DNA-binding protein [Pseudoxanthomonas sp.]|uniref:DNA-binding protein n=1 Tax=Pseudoxanthomonas sp. TaxID=1871049 RepID=UPI0025EA2FAC|nr:DNA-binding protein [Pseudoxanthomonas sp.]